MLQYVVIGLPQTGALPGFCMAAEYTTPCDAGVDAAVCNWQNVRSVTHPMLCFNHLKLV